MFVDLIEATKIDSLELLMVNSCAYAFGQVTVKISLCLPYRRLFVNAKLHKIVGITILYSVLWGVAFVSVAIFFCRPIHVFWNFTLQALPTIYCQQPRMVPGSSHPQHSDRHSGIVYANETCMEVEAW
jgi:hypothetical protein